jgi:hypothetical protein
MPCHGAGRSGTGGDGFVRIEAIVPHDAAERILDAIQAEFAPAHRVTVCIETVEVLRPEKF